MKIIHCADIHADSKMGTHFTREQADGRRKDITDSFGRMVTFARENEVTAIIIAGDLFDTKTSQQRSIKKRISYIISQNPQIDFLYLRGNHDEDGDFAAGDDLPNLKRFSKDKWTQYEYGQVVISGHEFGSTVAASVYSELHIDAQKINIVTLHGQVAGYRTKDGAPVISLPRLTNQNIDYIALGHIHDFRIEKLDKRCSWCYPGCLEGRGFDECGEKGFVLLTIEGSTVTPQFIPGARRQIHEITVPLAGTMSYTQILDAVTNKTKDIPPDDIVQVVLTGEISEETEIEPDSYTAALSKQFFYLRIKDKTEAKIEYEKYAQDVSLKGAFIRLVNGQTDLADEEKTKIIMTGIKALAGRHN
jgi:DNA repair protein SbcD/Mre11